MYAPPPAVPLRSSILGCFGSPVGLLLTASHTCRQCHRGSSRLTVQVDGEPSGEPGEDLRRLHWKEDAKPKVEFSYRNRKHESRWLFMQLTVYDP